MKKILLIPGATIKNKYSFFLSPELKYGKFLAFKPEIDRYTQTKEGDLEIDVYYWQPEPGLEWSFWQCLNPFNLINSYLRDRKFVLQAKIDLQDQEPQTANPLVNLQNKLKQKDYDLIFAHSMGCYLILEYLNILADIPNSLKKIVLLSSDAPRKYQINHPKIVHLIKNNNLKIYNLYCFYDQALFFSILVNRKIPGGLFGGQSNLLINQFEHLTLSRFPNTHNGFLFNRKLLFKYIYS